ncbi:ATP synthase subunit E [Halobellus salinus]|uniref:A-type ATP synthase subunit E n=1 Tax=Halobellus salinus TaxID=931585 RepID=A0A830E8R1_9EURY|nr:V-type ATP synthase subunit E [Halobellus salinus]GGJ02445.1 ATP synthase subunit E [Halobellus salinus]SMP17173.1 V/A-type H+-transporting ATPase subunit E [Halobellus salinus]
MSLDNVVSDIRDEANARAEEIRQEGERRAEEIVEAAETDAEALLDAREEAVERQIEQEREQAVSGAKLQAKQERLEARRDVLEDVRERAEAELRDLSGETREALTRALLDGAAEEFDGEEAVAVYGRDDDAELLESLVADYDGVEYGGEHDCLGGVVVDSTDSRVRVNNTFDSILDDVWEDSLKDVSGILFDQ